MSLRHFIILQGWMFFSQWLNVVQAFSIHGGTSEKSKEQKPICCLPNECEAFIYEDWAATLYAPVIYNNGSGRAVYSLKDQKMFHNQTGVSTLVGTLNEVEFWDYMTGENYHVRNGVCHTMGIDVFMPPLCIWANNATMISRGVFGDEDVPVETYSYIGLQGVNITTTMFIDDAESPPLCRPIQSSIVYASDLAVQLLISLSIADIGPIQSKDVFKVPYACKNVASNV